MQPIFALGERKVTKKREQNKINSFIFYAECIVTYLKIVQIEDKTKKLVSFFVEM